MLDLYQLSWHLKDGSVEMKSQMNITEHMAELPVEGPAAVAHEIHQWEQDVFVKYPLPDGAQWIICNEESRHFVLCDSATVEYC